MIVLVVMALANIVLGLTFLLYSDYLGAGAWISLGICLSLMVDVGISNLLLLNGHGMLSVKVMAVWITLITFIVLFTYKVLRDTRRVM